MKFTETDYGKFLPSHLARKREEDAAKRLEARQVLWRAAINEACLGPNREKLGRTLWFGHGVSLDDWPTLEALLPAERTAIIKEVRKIFGLPAVPIGGK